MVLGCAFMVFSGVIVLVDLREVGFALSLVVWGWLGCVGVEGWGGGGASLSVGVLGAFLLRGVGWDFSAC